MSIWHPHSEKILEHIKGICANTMVQELGIVIDKMNPDGVEGEMLVNDKTVQPMRLLHGGASCALAETLGSIASNMLLTDPKLAAVGQALTINYLRPGLEGEKVRGIARLIHRGKTTHLWRIDIYNQDKKLICTAELRNAVIEKK